MDSDKKNIDILPYNPLINIDSTNSKQEITFTYTIGKEIFIVSGKIDPEKINYLEIRAEIKDETEDQNKIIRIPVTVVTQDFLYDHIKKSKEFEEKFKKDILNKVNESSKEKVYKNGQNIVKSLSKSVKTYVETGKISKFYQSLDETIMDLKERSKPVNIKYLILYSPYVLTMENIDEDIFIENLLKGSNININGSGLLPQYADIIVVDSYGNTKIYGPTTTSDIGTPVIELNTKDLIVEDPKEFINKIRKKIYRLDSDNLPRIVYNSINRVLFNSAKKIIARDLDAEKTNYEFWKYQNSEEISEGIDKDYFEGEYIHNMKEILDIIERGRKLYNDRVSNELIEYSIKALKKLEGSNYSIIEQTNLLQSMHRVLYNSFRTLDYTKILTGKY
ncbi:hypothetical protein YN1_7790 [Nanoarchaeota archaeon]